MVTRYALPAAAHAKSWRRICVLLLGIVLWGWGAGGAVAAPSGEPVLEDLEYRVNVMVLKDAARARLTLKSLGPGRYRAEISGEPQGVLKLFTGQRRDSYQTEMIVSNGRLLPVVYREESLRKGKRRLNEYRFDRVRGRVELWQWKEGKGLVRRWQTPLQQEMFDPLTAFYNCRLGGLGPIKEGDTVKVSGIPYPRPEEIEVRIGGQTEDGRKTMITFINEAFENSRGVVYAYVDGSGAPRRAWTNILSMGKVTGELLPGGTSLKESLAELGAR